MWILPKQLHTLASVQDTEALISGSNEQSQICAQSLLVRSKPSPARIWSQKWKRDSWTQHLSGRILKPSLGQSFVTEWTSSLEVIPASHSVQQESVSELKTQDTSGPTLQMELLQCDQVSASLKTSRDISRWGCPTLLKTWDAWVTERRGEYSARVKSAHLTRESGSSSWPTVTASEARQGFQDRSRGMKGSQESLTTIVVKESNWATPEALNSTGYQISNGQKALRLGSQVTSGLAAPDNRSSVGSRQESWATPATRDTQTGKLNPRWVETLMGLPVGWVMPSCVHPITPIAEPTVSVGENWETPIAMDGSNSIASQEAAMKENERTGGNVRLSGQDLIQTSTPPVTIEPTSCDYWATESSLPQQNSHGELFGMS